MCIAQNKSEEKYFPEINECIHAWIKKDKNWEVPMLSSKTNNGW